MNNIIERILWAILTIVVSVGIVVLGFVITLGIFDVIQALIK